MQIAFEYLKREQRRRPRCPGRSRRWRRRPNSFAAHKALGDALLASNDIDGAIAELETSARLAPDSPSTHLSLAKAYQRAGRSDAAKKEREEFARLDRLMRTNRSGAAVGGRDRSAPTRARHLLLNDPYLLSSDSDHDQTSSRGTLARPFWASWRPPSGATPSSLRRSAPMGSSEDRRHRRPRRRRRPGQARDAVGICSSPTSRSSRTACRRRSDRSPRSSRRPPSRRPRRRRRPVAAPAAPRRGAVGRSPRRRPHHGARVRSADARSAPGRRSRRRKSYLGDKKETRQLHGRVRHRLEPQVVRALHAQCRGAA